MYFLSGLPRSGSTVLAALLNQRPDVHVTPTSGLIDIFGAICQAWEHNPTTLANKQTNEYLYSTLRKLIPERDDGKIVVDKSRGWAEPKIQSTMSEVLQSPPRIVASVRNVADCAASFVKIAKPNNLSEFFHGPLIQHLRSGYISLQEGYLQNPENILFIDYDELMENPRAEIAKIEAFWGLQHFGHDFFAIDGASVEEDDENAWGIPGLHTVGRELQRSDTDAAKILGEYHYRFQIPAFWKDEPELPTDPLNIQVEAALRGDFEEAEALCAAIQELRPTDNRAAFNRGWYALRHGRMAQGFELLDRGRAEGVFGNPNPSAMPKYEGQVLNGKTVLLVCEGGLGDQIHSARWARDIVGRGGRCVLACAPELAPLLLQAEGVSAVVESRAAGGVYHHFHVLGMSGYLSFREVNSAPYIPCRTKIRHTGRTGLRWAGNPEFEHEQHRTFDPTPLFNLPGELVSLQRDTNTDIIPPHVQRPCLDTWLDTKAVIESLDLVITSCTSVAHLAAAMGKETWIIAPILPYYLWADGKDGSIWYRNVKLYRQETFGDWKAPINKILGELKT